MASDETDASRGGAGAPPPPDQPNRASTELTREYSGDGIRVQWYAGRCIHVADCIRALPQVFDSKRRPWVDLSVPEAQADAVADAVLRCPTGAVCRCAKSRHLPFCDNSHRAKVHIDL